MGRFPGRCPGELSVALRNGSRLVLSQDLGNHKAGGTGGRWRLCGEQTLCPADHLPVSTASPSQDADLDHLPTCLASSWTPQGGGPWPCGSLGPRPPCPTFTLSRPRMRSRGQAAPEVDACAAGPGPHLP